MQKRLPAFVASLIFFTGAVTISNAATCNTVAACALYQNSGPGVGLEGSAISNVGVYGISTNSHGVDGRSTTSFGTVGITYANGNALSTARVGILGEDLGKGYYNGGVAGVSTSGAGAEGLSTAGDGLYGSSTDGVGVVASGGYAGAQFFGSMSNNQSTYGVIGEGINGGAFEALDSTGTGVYVYSSGTGVYINTANPATSAQLPALEMETS